MIRVLEQIGAGGATGAMLPTFQADPELQAVSATGGANWRQGHAMPIMGIQVVNSGVKFCRVTHLKGPPR